MLTRRGYLALAVAAVGSALAWRYGARSLNAIVAPIVVALVAAAVQVWRIRRPEVERTVGEYVAAGDTAPVTLRLKTPTGFDATVHDTVSDGVTAEGNRIETAVSETEVTYDVTPDERGRHQLGPVRIDARDVLGLCERTFTSSETNVLLAFPRTHELSKTGTHLDQVRRYTDRGRQEFDQVREYVRGDPLQDVHWKTSARQPEGDLFVKEYETPAEEQQLTVVAEATERVDEMAEAAASVVTYLLSEGLSVELVTADGVVPAGAGERQRIEVLTQLATTAGGRVPDRDDEEAAIRITEGDDGIQLRVDGRTSPFTELADRDRLATEAVAARADGGERR